MSLSRLILTVALGTLMLSACGEGGSPAMGNATAARPAGGPSEAEVEAVIERRVRSLATGVGSSHSTVDVNFDAIEFGEPRPLNEQDKIDGLRGDMAYPVRARFSELRTWGNGQTETVNTYYAYDFYRDAFGGWDYSGKGPVQ